MTGDPALASVRIIGCDSLGSTNAEALARQRAGEAAPFWITARQQTAGRGRRGRTWVSEPGNLYATLLLTDPGPAERAPELSFVAGLAAYDAVVESAPALGGKLGLKWPNDLLLNGAKVGGVLIEGQGARSNLAVAIGIGINCAHHPADTNFPATDLAAAGAMVTPEDLLNVLTRAMPVRIARWDRGAGFAAIRTDWIGRAAGLGGPMRVQLEERELTGTFAGLDARGRLLLKRSDGGFEKVTAGDVFPLSGAARPAAAGR